MTKYQTGMIIPVIVSGITKFGIFVKVDNLYTGLVHISEISEKFVSNPELFVKNGEKIYVEVLDCDDLNKQLKLSIKNIQYRNKGYRRRKIVETKHTYETLMYKLPFWIEENIKNHKNNLITIDKKD